MPSLSTGILSATQGFYTTAQLLLDITQGARVSSSSYNPGSPPSLSLQPHGAGAMVQPWQAVLERARSAPQIIEPGLLAASIPGGAGYAGIAGAGNLASAGSAGAGDLASAGDPTRTGGVAETDNLNGAAGEDSVDGVAAADRGGQIAAFSLGSAATLSGRIAALRERKRLVVADLPTGASGLGDLRTLSAAQPANELEIVVQRAPDQPGNELLWVAVAGLGGGHTLTSQTTNQRGLIATVDLAPTILRHLGLPVPDAIRGKPIELDGTFDGPYLHSFKTRLGVIYGRRLPALACLLGAWALLALAARLLPRDRARNRGRAWATRVGGLALLWTPVAALVPAALEPSRDVEYALIVLLCFSLGALTDRLLEWPRAPLAPAVVAVAALTADALLGTQLLVRSLLGPNPELGIRFYGIGNELKSGLAVLVFAAVAAALYPAVRGRRAATTMALTGICLLYTSPSPRDRG